jgi:hypothetical protein
MFSLSHLFAALKRLSTAVNRSAELFEAANDQLAARLAIDPGIDAVDRPALPEPVQENGHSKRLGRKAGTL